MTQRFANRDWYYDFNELQYFADEEEFKEWWIQKNVSISKITKDWDDIKNTEWLIRHFLAARMIMSATIHLDSLTYAEETNLRVVGPYLRYYTLLNSMRALVLCMPHQDWKDSALLNQNHNAIINTVHTCLMEINSAEAEKFKRQALRYKAERELISYRAPSSGSQTQSDDEYLKEICTVICELAQAYSELRSKSLESYKYKSPPEIGDYEILFNPIIEGSEFLDSEDYSRIVSILRKQFRPTCLSFIISEGHVEEFFNAWDIDDEEDEERRKFRPHNWRILFDFL